MRVLKLLQILSSAVASDSCEGVKLGMFANFTPLAVKVTDTVGSSCLVAVIVTVPGVVLSVAVLEAAPVPEVALAAAPNVDPGEIVQVITTPAMAMPLFLALTTKGAGSGDPGVAF